MRPSTNKARGVPDLRFKCRLKKIINGKIQTVNLSVVLRIVWLIIIQ